jgi:hypothetical protein
VNRELEHHKRTLGTPKASKKEETWRMNTMNEHEKIAQGTPKALGMNKEKEHQEWTWKKNTRNKHEE